jgi:hypothetical protein
MEWSIHKLMKLGLVFLQNSFNDLVRYMFPFIVILMACQHMAKTNMNIKNKT